MIQKAESGSYEHRALMRALYELRRALHGTLDEWEFLESEVTISEPLGEGASAAVFTGRFLEGPVAVKVFKTRHTSAGSSPDVTLSALSVQVSFPAIQSGCLLKSLEDMDSYIHKRELQTWFRLSHPHVQPFVGCCLTSPTPMILSPLVTHGTARSYREEHPEADWLKIVSGSGMEDEVRLKLTRSVCSSRR